MEDEEYLSPQGYHVTSMQVIADQDSGLEVLCVQSNQDRDAHRSHVYRSPDFALSEDRKVLDIQKRTYGIAKGSNGILHIAHTNNEVQREAGDGFVPFRRLNAEITGVFAGHDTLLVSGLAGYVARIQGDEVETMPIGQEIAVHSLHESTTGTAYAACEKGLLLRNAGGNWEAIPLGVGVDLNALDIVSDREIYICGSNGLCGVLLDDEFKQFDAPEARSYYATCSFQGRRYFGAGFQGLDILEDQSIVPFKERAFCYYISANEHQLLTSGIRFVSRYDGAGWLQIPFM